MSEFVLCKSLFEGITKDLPTAMRLRSAVFGGHGEMNSALQYFYHYANFKKLAEYSYSQIFLQNAVDEMEHFAVLSELILRLGVKVNTNLFNPFYFSYHSGNRSGYSKSRKQMILDDIILEKNSIALYLQLMSRIKNLRVNKILNLILNREKEHLKQMEKLYNEINKPTKKEN